MKNKGYLISAGILLVLAFLWAGLAGRAFLKMFREESLRPSSGLTSKKMLSDYASVLTNTPGDTPVFVYEGSKKGGRALILGGTHPNEPAGHITAVLMLEHIKVQNGTVFIIPRANNSGFTHSDPQEGNPQEFFLKTSTAARRFRFGSRLTNPVHQWPDPSLYINPSGQKLSGAESRNLNRCYPGREHGTLTEKIAFAIVRLIQEEKIDLAVDLHEAALEYPVINAIVFHEKSAELAAIVQMELQAEGFEFRLEVSPPNLRGLSHREWGDFTPAFPLLLETANVSQGRLKGKTSQELILTGKDKFYLRAFELGRLFVPYDSRGIPLKNRAASHLAAVSTFLANMAFFAPEKKIHVTGLPRPEDLIKNGLETYLVPGSFSDRDQVRKIHIILHGQMPLFSR
ncbi:MAG: succinylglutamate desuccinylase/aspartoacylase family protein [Candidatus Aminicenantes bacterium]|nr:succinylglutamate desuccinylase/aspartoacylase family protein [Candidatus Aminicenantes bacterium]